MTPSKDANLSTLVLLPGMDGSGELFMPFLQACGDAFKTIVVRYPNNRAMDYLSLTSLVYKALPADGPFVLLGESFSGPIAIAIAASNPARLKGLILCCTFARNPLPQLAPWHRLSRQASYTIQKSALFTHRFLANIAANTWHTAVAQALSQVPPQVLQSRLHAARTVNVYDELSSIDVPVLYLRAAQDRLVPQAATDLAQQAHPAMKIVTFAAPHFLLQAAPAQAAKAVAAFIANL